MVAADRRKVKILGSRFIRVPECAVHCCDGDVLELTAASALLLIGQGVAEAVDPVRRTMLMASRNGRPGVYGG